MNCLRQKEEVADLEVQEKCNVENKVPIYQKLNLTLKEAAEYSNIGINRLSAMVAEPDCSFALFVGSKRLIKRLAFEEYINSNSLHFL